MPDRKTSFLDAVDLEVHADFGRSREVISGLDGAPWHQTYRTLRDELGVPGERACDLTILADTGQLAPKDPADIGAVD